MEAAVTLVAAQSQTFRHRNPIKTVVYGDGVWGQYPPAPPIYVVKTTGCGSGLGAGAARAEGLTPPIPSAVGQAAAASENSSVSELLSAAREAVEEPALGEGGRVSQDDIDSLFGE